MTVRTFETLSPYGWAQRAPHQINPGSIVRVLDDGEPQSIAGAMLEGDAGIYFVVRVQTAVGVVVGTATGVEELAISFTAPD
jgi:hypothetical protein